MANIFGLSHLYDKHQIAHVKWKEYALLVHSYYGIVNLKHIQIKDYMTIFQAVLMWKVLHLKIVCSTLWELKQILLLLPWSKTRKYILNANFTNPEDPENPTKM